MNIPKETILGTPEMPKGPSEAEQEKHYHIAIWQIPPDHCCKPSQCKETLHVNSVYGQWPKEKTGLGKGVKGHK